MNSKQPSNSRDQQDLFSGPTIPSRHALRLLRSVECVWQYHRDFSSLSLWRRPWMNHIVIELVLENQNTSKLYTGWVQYCLEKRGGDCSCSAFVKGPPLRCPRHPHVLTLWSTDDELDAKPMETFQGKQGKQKCVISASHASNMSICSCLVLHAPDFV